MWVEYWKRWGGQEGGVAIGGSVRSSVANDRARFIRRAALVVSQHQLCLRM